MSVYFVANSTIVDQALLADYVQSAGALGSTVPLKLLAADLQCQNIEGESAGSRTVILEFESEDDFRRWYDSPGYQAILPKRLAATNGFAMLVHGV